MKKEIRDRIKELKGEMEDFQKKNNDIVANGQKMQQQISMNNTEIIKRQGAIEELEKVKD